MPVNKVIYGNSTLIDLTSDTVTADNLLAGYTAHDKSGTLITGIAVQTGGGVVDTVTTLAGGGDHHAITADVDLTQDTVAADKLLQGYTAHDSSGTAITGTYVDSEPVLQTKSVSPTESSQTITPDSGYDGLSSVSVGAISSTYVGSGITRRSSSNLTVNGNTVTAPAGYYSSSASKAVASGSATTPATSITANPTISVNSSGLISASVSTSKSVTPDVSAGYISEGTSGTISVTGSNTSQLSTQGATTITPSTSSQTAVAAGKYTTGAITVAAIPSEYIIPSGSLSITTNGTHDVTNYASASVNVTPVLIAKTVTPNESTQVITAGGTDTYLDINEMVPSKYSYSGTNIGSTWNISWNNELIVNDIYDVTVDFYRAGYARHYTYNSTITFTSFPFSITVKNPNGSQTTSLTINSDNIRYPYASDDDEPGQNTLTISFTKTETADGLSQVIVNPIPENLPKNVVFGSFYSETNSDTVNVVNLSYTGTGYPIAVVIYVKGGFYASSGPGADWYALNQQYAIGYWSMVKRVGNVAPGYSDNTTNEYGLVSYGAKMDASNSFSVGGSYSERVYSNVGASAGRFTCVCITSNKTLSIYTTVTSGTYGLVAGIEYEYAVIYSTD